MSILDAVLLLVAAALALALLPPAVIVRVLLGALSSGALIWLLAWFDLDRFAILFGPLSMVASVWGIPWAMSDRVWRYPRFRFLVGATSLDDLIVNKASTARLMLLAFLLMLALGATGTLAVRASIQLFDLAELVLDDGQPS